MGGDGHDDDQTRQKRQILGALALGFTSIFGVYGATQVHRLDQSISRLDQQQLRTDSVLLHQSHRLQEVEATLADQRVAIEESLSLERQIDHDLTQQTWTMENILHIEEFATLVHHLTHAIQSAKQGYLTTTILSSSDAAKLFKKLTHTATELGGKPIITSSADLFRLPVTVAVTGKHHLRILVHVGVAREQLRLFRYRPAPMVVRDGSDEVVLIIRPPRTLIAHNDHVHQELEETDLAGCVRNGNTYTCQGPSIFHTQLRKTCLGALFAGDLTQVRLLCPVERTEVQWTAESLAANEVATYFRNRTTLQLSCPDRPRSNRYVQGNQIIRIPTNCSLLGDDLRIDSYTDVLLQAPVTTHPAWNTTEFLEGRTPQQIIAARAALERHQLRPEDNVRELVRQEHHLQEVAITKTTGQRYIIAFLVSLGLYVVTVILVTVRCVYLWRRGKRVTEAFNLRQLDPPPMEDT